MWKKERKKGLTWFYLLREHTQEPFGTTRRRKAREISSILSSLWFTRGQWRRRRGFDVKESEREQVSIIIRYLISLRREGKKERERESPRKRKGKGGKIAFCIQSKYHSPFWTSASLSLSHASTLLSAIPSHLISCYPLLEIWWCWHEIKRWKVKNKRKSWRREEKKNASP